MRIAQGPGQARGARCGSAPRPTLAAPSARYASVCAARLLMIVAACELGAALDGFSLCRSSAAPDIFHPEQGANLATLLHSGGDDVSAAFHGRAPRLKGPISGDRQAWRASRPTRHSPNQPRSQKRQGIEH